MYEYDCQKQIVTAFANNLLLHVSQKNVFGPLSEPGYNIRSLTQAIN